MEKILAIKPGPRYTSIAAYNGDNLLFQQTADHAYHELAKFERVFDQCQYRLDVILQMLHGASINPENIDAVVGTGGLLRPVGAGIYQVNERMLADLKLAEHGEHPFNLGAGIASGLASRVNIPAFIVDPMTVDEMELEARASGWPELPRTSQADLLLCRSVASEIGDQYKNLNLIIAELGNSFTISAHQRGRMLDASNSLEDGAFSLDSCGGLPTRSLVKLCYSGKYSEKEMLANLNGAGGVFAYLGTKDVYEVEKRIRECDSQAKIVLRALAYQVAKDIGAMAAVLGGSVDKIILTGEITNSEPVVKAISTHVQFIAPVVVIQEAEILPALVERTLCVLRGKEVLKTY